MEKMFVKFVVGGAIIGAIAAIIFHTDIRVGAAGCAMIGGAIYLKYA